MFTVSLTKDSEILKIAAELKERKYLYSHYQVKVHEWNDIWSMSGF